MSRMTTGEKAFQYFALLLLTVMCVTMLYPFIHVLSLSLSTPAAAAKPGFHLYPEQISLEAYKLAFSSDGLWYGFYNSIFRTVLGTCLSLFFMLLGAYALSKKYLPDRTFYTMIIILTMFISGGLIPTYMLVKGVGLFDSRWVYILPILINTFSLLILRNFLMNLPQELEDSAKIDGASELRLLFSIVVPLSKPVLATLGLWSAVQHWNEWFDALIYITDNKKFVLQIILRRLIIEENLTEMMNFFPVDLYRAKAQPDQVKAAILMIITFPILVVYPFLQKHFVKGIMVGSVKG